MWRQTDDRKVWYEWIVEVFVLHDEPAVSSSGKGKGKKAVAKEEEEEGKEGGGGRDDDVRGRGEKGPTSSGGRKMKNRKTRVAISDLHSSIKEACLM
jgi:type II protein arginine methyltransferase